MTQLHTYDPALSYHFANLALASEVQPLWEADEPHHDSLEDLFAIPRKYYDQPFVTDDDLDGTALYDDIHGYVREHYDLVGAIRVGTDVIPDYTEMDEQWAWSEMDSFERIFSIVNSYSRRLSETISNTVRYSLSNLLMGYVLRAKDDRHGVVVLRGTVSVNEWLNNMNYRLVRLHPRHADYGLVHNGFRNVYKGIRGRFRQLLVDIAPENPLYLVGHSLGGAVAQIAALDLALQMPARAQHVQVYAYASPRIGNKTFVSLYDQTVPTSYRIVNVCDVVPYVPFEQLGAFLQREPSPYADTKGELAYVHQAGNPISNHVSSYHIATRERIPAPLPTVNRPFAIK